MSQEAARASVSDASATAVVLASSDNTADVGAQIIASHRRFWDDCPYRRYVTLSSAAEIDRFPGWVPLVANQRSGWRTELSSALRKLPGEVTHVILFLDDFLLLRRVDETAVARLVAEARRRNAGYLRLVPVARSLPVTLFRRLRIGPRVEALGPEEPYRASLQAAIWRRDYLVRMLKCNGSIWDFEHQFLDGEAHLATSGAGPVRYLHAVERGRWLPHAPRLFSAAGLQFAQGDRAIWPLSYRIRHALGRAKFAIFGYAPLKLKRHLRAARARIVPRT